MIYADHSHQHFYKLKKFFSAFNWSISFLERPQTGRRDSGQDLWLVKRPLWNNPLCFNRWWSSHSDTYSQTSLHLGWIGQRNSISNLFCIIFKWFEDNRVDEDAKKYRFLFLPDLHLSISFYYFFVMKNTFIYISFYASFWLLVLYNWRSAQVGVQRDLSFLGYSRKTYHYQLLDRPEPTSKLQLSLEANWSSHLIKTYIVWIFYNRDGNEICQQNKLIASFRWMGWKKYPRIWIHYL